MNSVIFGFSKPIKFHILSYMIEKIEKRPFSHSYMRFKEPVSGQDVVFQASGMAVNLRLFSSFKAVNTVVVEYELLLNAKECHLLWAYVLETLGMEYSVLELLNILINKVTGLNVGNSSGVICSELAAKVSGILGLPVPGDLDYITPSDFNEFCKQYMQKIA